MTEAAEMTAAQVIAQQKRAMQGSVEFEEDAEIQGWAERITPHAKVIELDVQADPEKRDPRFLEEAMRRQRNLREFRREYLRDRTSAAGNAVYPEFSEHGGIQRYCMKLPGILPGPVYRGWDFGLHPAVAWGQVSPTTGRVFLYREFVPKSMQQDIQTGVFADVTRYLSGQVEEEDKLSVYARDWIERIRLDGSVPPSPWFPPGTQFIDYAGPECFARSPNVEADVAETSAYEILAARGIHLIAPRVSPKWRMELIRSLLTSDAQDGGPMLVIDISMKLLIGALLGLLAFPQGTKLRPYPERPRKDGTYDDLHDAVGYMLLNIKPLIEHPAQAVHDWDMQKARDGWGGGTGVRGRYGERLEEGSLPEADSEMLWTFPSFRVD